MTEDRLTSMDRSQLEDTAGDYDIDHSGMDDAQLRAAILEAENSIDTSEEDDFEAGMAQELAQRKAAAHEAEGHIDESQHPMLAGKTAQPQVDRTSEPKRVRATSGTSHGLKIEANREERNGVKRPSAGGKCRGIWDMLDTAQAQGATPTAKTARELGAAQGFDKTTIMVQFYRWRKFNGIEGRQ